MTGAQLAKTYWEAQDHSDFWHRSVKEEIHTQLRWCEYTKYTRVYSLHSFLQWAKEGQALRSVYEEFSLNRHSYVARGLRDCGIIDTEGKLVSLERLKLLYGYMRLHDPKDS